MQIEHPFPKRLRQARLAAKLSQRELGIKIGIDASSASSRMNHYEKGRHTPDYSITHKISDVLKVPVAFFYCDLDSDAERLIKIARLDFQELANLDEVLDRFTRRAT